MTPEPLTPAQQTPEPPPPEDPNAMHVPDDDDNDDWEEAEEDAYQASLVPITLQGLGEEATCLTRFIDTMEEFLSFLQVLEADDYDFVAPIRQGVSAVRRPDGDHSERGRLFRYLLA